MTHVSAEEQIALAARVKAGDRAAADPLIAAVLPFIKSRGRWFGGRLGLDRGDGYLSDLVQEGAIGVLHAAVEYDSTRGVKFLTYASHWIDQRIRRRVEADAAIVHVPFNVRSEVKRGKYAWHRDDLADKIRRAIHNAEHTFALDAGTHLGAALHDTIVDGEPSPEDKYETISAAAAVRRMVDAIEDVRLRIIVQRRFLAEPRHSLESLGRTLSVTRERVRQLELKALGALLRLAGVTDRTPREVLADYHAMCAGDGVETDGGAEVDETFVRRCGGCGVRVDYDEQICSACRKKGQASPRRCRLCGFPGHNVRKCRKGCVPSVPIPAAVPGVPAVSVVVPAVSVVSSDPSDSYADAIMSAIERWSA